MVIAIDGPAGVGKSSVAAMLAARLPGAFRYLNSGKLYRAITLGCLRSGIDPLDGQAALALAETAGLEYRGGRVLLGGEDVSDLLHTDEIDRLAPPLSAFIPIRRLVNSLLREIARKSSIIVEGRDMTGEVFPDAEFRFFLDASARKRAERRLAQGTSELAFGDILAAIELRDERDRNKGSGSLALVPGVEYLDTSDLTIEEGYGILEGKITKQGQTMAQMEVESDTSPVQGGNIQTQLQEKYLKSFEQLEEGQQVDGTVIQITADQVFVDVGYKSEGKIPLQEFTEVPKIGDVVSVVLVTKENKRGEVIVSKQKADAKISWKNLSQAFKDNVLAEGVIEKQVKGGYDVNLGGGLRAFLPISQADIQRVEEPESLLGLKTNFQIERLYSEGKVNIVVNRRKCMEEELDRKREEFLANTPIGSDVSGIVKTFTSFGAFVDLGGFDGLLHINDMSWGHVTRPKDFVKKGQEIKLKVVRVDPVEKRINLSLKHFTDDPWVHFENKFKVNDIVKGKVTKLTDFGAFIEIEEGIEGLAHISEFSWTRKVQKPQDVVKPGDIVECMILGYDLQAGRVSLGLKQVTVNPWDDIDGRYPEGTRLSRPVVKLTNAGAFVQLEEGIDAFLHIDDISWTKKVRHPGNELAVGNEVEVIVLSLDKQSRNIRVGIKQLSEDPWRSFGAAYGLGSQVEGEVSSVTDFGLFLRVPGGIEGLIHKSNLTENKDENPDEALARFKVGDRIRAIIIDMQEDRQKLSFSIRDYQKKVQKEENSRYMDRETGAAYTLGDFLKDKSDSGHEKAKESLDTPAEVGKPEVKAEPPEEKPEPEAEKPETEAKPAAPKRKRKEKPAPENEGEVPEVKAEEPKETEPTPETETEGDK